MAKMTITTTGTTAITIELGKTKFEQQELSIPVTVKPATEAPAETGAIAPATEAPAETGAIAPTEVTPLKKMQNEHEKAVEIFCELEAEEMGEFIMWAQHRHNKFPTYAVKELRDSINADDVYKDAIVKICSPLGEEVTRKAIKLVDSKKILDLSEYLKHVKIIVEEWGDI